MAKAHYERLAAQDITFLPQESAVAPTHISWLWIFEATPLRRTDGALDVERVRGFLDARTSRIARLRQVLAFVPIENDPVWVDATQFDIAEHVRFLQLEAPGDEATLLRVAAKIHGECLDRMRPLWEICVLDGLTQNRFAIVCRMHHCMVDGGAIVYLMSQIFSEKPTTTFAAVRARSPRPAPDGNELLRDAVSRRIAMPTEIVAEAKRLFAHLQSPDHNEASTQKTDEASAQPTPKQRASKQSWAQRALATWSTVRAGVTLAPKTSLNAPIDAEREIRLCQQDVESALAIRKVLGGTVNDVLLAAVASAVRAYLLRKGETPPAGFRVVVPVSTRSTEALAKLGNDASAWVVTLPIDEPDASKRYQKLLAETSHYKESKQSLGATTLFQTAEWAGAHMIALGVAVLGALRPYNLIVSNHPRLDNELYLLEAKLLEGYPLNPLFANQGLVISLTSYRGALMIALIANPTVVPDLSNFAQDLEAGFAELRALAAKG